jgi:hypothetical protein
MKRLTISMDDDLYRSLLEYAADQSKRNVRRLSLGEAVRTLISIQLEGYGYDHNSKDHNSKANPLQVANMDVTTRQLR